MNLSNFLSLLRFPLSALSAILIYNNQIKFAIFFGFISGITDYLDGYFARKFNQITELGKILDPLADKFMIFTIGIAMLMKGYFPLWFIILAIVRDLMILSGGLYVKRKMQIVLPSIMAGKIAFLSVLLVILGLLFEIPYSKQIGIPFSATLLGASFILYAIRFIKEMNNFYSKNNG